MAVKSEPLAPHLRKRGLLIFAWDECFAHETAPALPAGKAFDHGK